jgi:NitT/TauT family transport system substrate-binding protein
LELIPFKGGKEVQQALAMGSIDIGSAGATNFFIPIAKGSPIKIIAPLAVSPTLVFVDPSSNIKTFDDLVGKTIASRIGQSSNISLGYALRKENIPINTITFEDIEGNLRPLALMEKKVVDVAVAGEYNEKIYLDYGAVVFEEWITKGYADKPMPRTVIAVNTDSLEKNKEEISSFIDAIIESQRYIKDNPDDAAVIISKQIEEATEGAVVFSVEELKEQWKTVKYVLWYEPSDVVEISKVAQEIGDIQTALSVEQIFDLSFEEKLKNAQDEIY